MCCVYYGPLKNLFVVLVVSNTLKEVAHEHESTLRWYTLCHHTYIFKGVIIYIVLTLEYPNSYVFGLQFITQP